MTIRFRFKTFRITFKNTDHSELIIGNQYLPDGVRHGHR